MTASPVLSMPVPIVHNKRSFGHYQQPSFDHLPSSPPPEDAPTSPLSHWSGSPRSDAGAAHFPTSLPEPRHMQPASAPPASRAFKMGAPPSHPVAISYGGHWQRATSQIRGGPYEQSSPESWRASYSNPNPKDAWRVHPSGMLVSAPTPSKGWSDLSDLRAMASPPMSRPQPPVGYFAPSSLDSLASTAPRSSNEYHFDHSAPVMSYDGMPHPGLVSSTEQLPVLSHSGQQPDFFRQQQQQQQQQQMPDSAGSSYQRDIPQTPPSATFPPYNPSAPTGFSAPYPQPMQNAWGEQELLSVDEADEFSDEKVTKDGRRVRTAGRHVCSVCDKRFNRPSSLNTHMSVHTGAKPYQCPKPDCALRFSVSSNLRRHMRTHEQHSTQKKERTERGSEMSPVDVSSSDEGQQFPHYVPPHMQNGFSTPYGFSASYPPPGQYPTPQLYTPSPAFADMHLSNDMPRSGFNLSRMASSPKATDLQTPKTPATDKMAQNSNFYSPISFTRP